MLCLPLALLHEASLRGAGQRPAVAAHGFGHAGVALAFLQEAGLGSTRQGFAVLAHGLALASFLRRGDGEIQGQHYGSKQNPLHVSLLPWHASDEISRAGRARAPRCDWHRLRLASPNQISSAFELLVALAVIAAALLDPSQTAVGVARLVGIVLIQARVQPRLARRLARVFRRDRRRA